MIDRPGFKSLGPGSRVALVAPAGPFERDKYEKGENILKAAGYEIVPGKNIFRKAGYLAGSDRERLEDFTAAVMDPEIEAIVCIRGGYGSGRLLPLLPFSKFHDKQKFFIGHSDITFLHVGLVGGAGWTTFHGPNLTGMTQWPQSAESVLKTLSGENRYQWTVYPEQVMRAGAVEGRLLGGNLTCLTHMIGTPYMPDLAGALLLLEDCGEALYRLDRMMNHLKLAGILPQLGAILLGDFTDCAEKKDIYSMVMDHLLEYDFPVVHSLPFGHGSRNEVVPFGPRFLLDTNERVFKIIASPVAH